MPRMSDQTRIEWTDATWNPIRGCTKISPGCTHCYAETFAERFRGVPGHPYEQGFDLRTVPGKLAEPLRWRSSRMVFVNSMSDLFHRDVPDDYIREVVRVMRPGQLAHVSGLDQAIGPDAELLDGPIRDAAEPAADLVGGERREPSRRLPADRRSARHPSPDRVPVDRALARRPGSDSTCPASTGSSRAARAAPAPGR